LETEATEQTTGFSMSRSLVEPFALDMIAR
jgi:hypothetical protein